jgi:hypothetical protein
MNKGDPIKIEEIHNGVMITPAPSPFKDPDISQFQVKNIIAFQNADDFIQWIKTHFSIFEVPKWDDDEPHT